MAEFVPPALPLADTAGTGASLLARVIESGARSSSSVLKPCTRAVLALKFAKGTSVGDVEQLLSASLAPNSVATGLGLFCGSCLLLVSEARYEDTAHLLRRLSSSSSSSSGAAVVSGRVVVSIEDCPSRLFGPLAVRAVTGSADAPGAAAADAPLKLSTALCAQLRALADRLASDSAAMGGGGEAGRIHPNALEGLDRYASLIPILTESKLDGMTSNNGLVSLSDWLALYAGPLDIDPGAEEVLPLPPRVPY